MDGSWMDSSFTGLGSSPWMVQNFETKQQRDGGGAESTLIFTP